MEMFKFGDIVVIGKLVGVVVKCWRGKTPHYEVYVRSANRIHQFTEDKIKRYVHHKEITDDDLQYY